MPRYNGVLTLEDEGPDTPVVHLFDYSNDDENETTTTSRSNYKKQIIAVESCIYLDRQNLTTLKSQSQARNTTKKDQSQASANLPEGSTNSRAAPGTETANEEGGKEEEEAKQEKKDAEERQKGTEVYLKEGQEFQGYILKCPNGPYDYAMKLWDTEKAAPPEAWYPKEGEEVAAVVVDRTGDLLTVACGANVALARKKAFLCAGVDPDDLSLPFARLKVTLRRLHQRDPLVPAAGWEASPTQVVVPPYDIY